MDRKFVTIDNMEFMCEEDGTCYIFHTGDARGKCKNPYWKKVGGRGSQGYLVFHSNKNGSFKIHRIIASAFLGLDIKNLETEVDHIDGDRSNNKVSNLRIVTHTQNCMNYQKKEIKGLLKTDYGWRAYINHNKARYSKRFKTQEEAIEWRKAKEIEFGYSHSTLYE